MVNVPVFLKKRTKKKLSMRRLSEARKAQTLKLPATIPRAAVSAATAQCRKTDTRDASIRSFDQLQNLRQPVEVGSVIGM